MRYHLLLMLLCSSFVMATPFETCSSKAYLFQRKPLVVYEVNLLTGNYEQVTGTVASGRNININGLGFDYYFNEQGQSESYFYGFSTTTLEFMRLDKDFNETTLPLINQPSGSFYVGDVYNHHYYFYRTGSGLYKVNLDDAADNYLEVQTITRTARVQLTDFAFHPSNNYLYGIDNRSGVLHQFDIDTGAATAVGNTGVTGTFGAAYFDSDGYMYISRNSDGHIFRINPGSDDVSAEFFAYGPSSNQNDGARCVQAALISDDDSTQYDFGDAPESYGNSIDSNGPRHEFQGELFLGVNQPGDDNNNDGLGLVTGLVKGLDSPTVVTASKEAYLQAWVDWNQDGVFSAEDEQIAKNQRLQAGSNVISLEVPVDAEAGVTWARLRYGSQQDIGPLGGATDGEVEDHQVVVTDEGVSYSYYPSADGWTTLAYEDLWPYEGDYDMNDVVFHYRTVTVEQAGQLKRVDFHGQLVAIGASYHNGFAIRVPGVQASAVDTQAMKFTHIINGGEPVHKDNPIEQGSDELIAIITDDVWQLVDTNCDFYRTSSQCMDDIQFEFELRLPFTELQSASSISTLYDPFIFATPNRYHGSYFNSNPGREWEMHLADMEPTEQADTGMLATGDDTSSQEQQRFFKNANNLPWAMEMATSWKHPKSGVDLLQAYPKFRDHILSNKQEFKDWYQSHRRVDSQVYP